MGNIFKLRKWPMTVWFFILLLIGMAIGIIPRIPAFDHELLEENSLSIVGISFALVVLSFSTYMSARENLVIESRQALWNARAFALQANTLIFPTNLAYRQAAIEWFNQAKKSQKQAKLRIYCAKSCLLGLIPLIFALVFALLKNLCFLSWTVFIGASIGCILFAVVIHIKQEEVSFLKKCTLGNILQPDPNKKYFDQTLKDFPRLKEHQTGD